MQDIITKDFLNHIMNHTMQKLQNLNDNTKNDIKTYINQYRQGIDFNIQKQSLIHRIQELENQTSALESDIFSLQEKIEFNEILIKVLEHLKQYKLESKKNFILSVINTALRDIFQDDILIDIQQEIDKKTKYNIVLLQRGVEIGRNDELLKTNGGGVLSVISVLFKILIGYLYSKNKFYIFDESFSQVSPEYRERLSLFLRKFAEKYGFTIVVVSQTSDLNKYAHLLYKVNYKYEAKNIKKEKIELKTLYIEEKEENLFDYQPKQWFYSKIKNFQSIKNCEFEYKGLTIIVGPNNCGKSASLRALKSIIYNDFNAKYLRLGEKEAVIEFGTKGEINYNIKLIYKSKKVIFEIDEEQYLGKNLSSEVLKQAVEKIGFKYINIKKLYKNIKGNLRQQTENIAYSSQYDNLFLIGSKSSDIEKVFNFLFNTEYITSIIMKYKEINLETDKEIKDKDKFLKLYLNELDQLKVKLDFISVLELTLLVKRWNEQQLHVGKLTGFLSNLNTSKEKINRLIQEYSLLSQVINESIKYFTYQKNFDNVFKKLKLLNIKKEKIVDFLEKIDLNQLEKIKDLFDINKTSRDLINHKIEINLNEKNLKLKLNFILNFLNKVNLEDLNNLQKFINLKIELETYHQRLQKKLEILNSKKELIFSVNQEIEKLGVEKCPHCHGYGIIFKNKEQI